MDTTDFRDFIDKLAAVEAEAGPCQRFTYVPLPQHVQSALKTVQASVVPAGTKARDVDHVTLVYAHEAPKALTPEHVDHTVKALREAAEDHAPIDAKLQGWAYFDGALHKGKPATALVALIDAPGLAELHVDLKSALKLQGHPAADTHGFNPHVTLAYLDHGQRVPNLPKLPEMNFTIDKVMFSNRESHGVLLKGSVGGMAAKAASIKSAGAKSAVAESADFNLMDNRGVSPPSGLPPFVEAQPAVAGGPAVAAPDIPEETAEPSTLKRVLNFLASRFRMRASFEEPRSLIPLPWVSDEGVLGTEAAKVAAAKHKKKPSKALNVGTRILKGLGGAVAPDVASTISHIPLTLGAGTSSGRGHLRTMLKAMQVSRQMGAGALPRVNTFSDIGPAYAPGGSLYIPPGTSEAVIAHEVGHKRLHQLMGKSLEIPSMLSRIMSRLAPISGAWAGASKDPTRLPGYIQAASAIPSLFDEGGATAQALYHMAKEHGVAGVAKAWPLIPAFGTYAGHALAPLGVARLREHFENDAKTAVDQLSGGKGDHKPRSAFDSVEFAKGQKVEREHTHEQSIANEITADHLTENPKYYSILQRAGLADELEKAALFGSEKYLTPALRAVRFPQAVGRVVQTLAADVPHTPRLLMKSRTLAERAALGAQAGEAATKILAESPEILPMQLVPVPGLTPTYLAAKNRFAKWWAQRMAQQAGAASSVVHN